MDFTPSQPRELPNVRARSLPALVGHCWTDTGGKKQENACVREKATLPFPAGCLAVPTVLSTAHPSGHRLELRGATRPAERGQRPLMVLVGLRLALCPLGLRVRGRWVWLLHRHGPAQVVALAQKLRLSVQPETALAQDHARVILLGARAVAGLQCRQVCGVAFTQELWRGQASG